MAVKKSKKNSHICIYVVFKDNVFTAVKERGTGIQKRYLFSQKWKGVLPQGGASEYNPLFSNIWEPLSLISSFTLTYFMIFVIPGLLFYGIMQLFGHLLLLTKETMKKVCVCLASTWYNHLVSNVTAYFVSILFSSVLFPVIHSAHIAHEWLLLKCSAIILGWYKIW